MLKRVEFYIAIAVIIGGIFVYLNLPKKVEKLSVQVEEMQRQDIRQTTILENTVKNQERLINLHDE